MIYLIAFVFIALDFATGIVKGAATGTFSSSIMREGLYKKLGLILCMALGYLVDYAQVYIDLGVTVPVAATVCAYICVMEIGSTLENICKINPDIMPDKLTALFGVAVTTDATGEQTTDAIIPDIVAAASAAATAAADAFADASAQGITTLSEKDTADEATATETITDEEG